MSLKPTFTTTDSVIIEVAGGANTSFHVVVANRTARAQLSIRTRFTRRCDTVTKNI